MGSPALSDREFALFQAFMRERTGVFLGPAKKSLVVSRLAKRLQQLRLDSFTAYFQRIAGGRDPEELQRALDLLTTHETYFFREPGHFDYLAGQLLSQVQAGRAFRVWSAASSTGEEAYSLAMVLMDKLGPDAAWEVVGTDISLAVLERARTGIYGLERIDGLPRSYLQRFCLRGIGERTGTLLIDCSLRSRVRFVPANLNGDLSILGDFDVVFLRNVLIYFEPATKREVVARVLQRLKPGGQLFVGHSESLGGIDAPLRLLRPSVYCKA